VHIGVPTEKEREQILQVLLSSLQTPEKAQLCSKIARLTPGYVGADLSLLCQDVVLGRCRKKVCTLFSVSTCTENFDLV
jgi:SpoVK/Ycf46/Vps4 family AAA+-type ATPase